MIQKEYVHASFCTGIGACELAAMWMGWRNAFSCEIDPFCHQVLKYYYPHIKHYGNIFGTDFSEWRGRVNVITAGFPCFVAGTPVLTKRGFLPIDEVRIGDEVLTTDRSYHPVECTMRHTANEIIYLRAQGMYKELKCTPNHPFYARSKRRYYENGTIKTVYGEAKYVKASELAKGDKVGYPIHEGSDTSFTTAFWKLVGAWIADGWTDIGKRKGRKNCCNHKAIICCGKKHIARLNHIIQKAGFKYTLSEERTTFKCIICNKKLCEFLQDFGKYAHGKHLTPQCFMLDRSRKKALLDGWFADGYKKPNGAQCVTTVSERLALDMAQIARDVYLCPVSISRKMCNRVCVIEGREVNERPQYCVTISNCEKYGFYEDGFVWCNIKSIRREKESNEVFNLSVNEEHSYNVYGIAVHNCQPFSCAGSRKGAEDDRYLWPEVLRGVDEIRPNWFIGENVAGITSMVLPGDEIKVESYTDLEGESYLETEMRQQFIVDRICNDLESIGYSVQPIIIPACAVGAPHRRDRIWFIAHGGETIANCSNARTEGMQQGENGIYEFEVTANTDKELLEARDAQRPQRRENQGFTIESFNCSSCWENFPSQSPVRFRYDGISNNVVRYIKTEVYDAIKEYIRREDLPRVWEAFQKKKVREQIGGLFEIPEPNLLLEVLQRTSENRRYEQEQNGLSQFSEETSGRVLCYLRKYGTFASSPFGQKYKEQFAQQFGNIMPELSYEIALATKKIVEECERTASWVRAESIKAYGNSMVPQLVYQIFKAIGEVENLLKLNQNKKT